jgi:hypothetical protein
MGWQNFTSENGKVSFEGFESFEPGGETQKDILNLLNEHVLKTNLTNNYNNIHLSSHFTYLYPPAQKVQKHQKGKKSDIRLIWENPFPQGTPEARAESLRVVAEAVAETLENEKEGGNHEN